MKKIAKISIAVLCLSAMSSAALAAKPGFYLGAGVGGSNLETPKKVLYPNVPANLMTQSYDRNGIAGRGFAGYNFNEYIGLEAGLAKYGDASYKAKSGAVYNGNLDYSLAALDLVAKGYLPIGVSGFNLYALAGIAYVNSEVKYKDTLAGVVQNNGKTSVQKVRPVYGVGASYDIPNSNFTTNVEYSRIQGLGNVETSPKAIPTANLVTLNFNYNFG